MPRLLAIAAALAALVAGGCGGGDDEPARAPAAGFAPDAARGVLLVERIRARLVPVSDLAGLGRPLDGIAHLAAADSLWRRVERRVEAGDAVLAREVSVAFDRTRRALTGTGTFDAVRDVAGPLEGQLLGGVREELVPDKEARLAPAVKAAALVALLDDFERHYAEGVQGADERAQALERAFGSLVRAQALAREIVDGLGPRRDAVVEGLKGLREATFPDGLVAPGDPGRLDDARRRVADVQRELRARFELS